MTEKITLAWLDAGNFLCVEVLVSHGRKNISRKDFSHQRVCLK